MTNPLLDYSGPPRFDLVKPDHVAPAIDQLLAEARAAVAAAETAPATWDDFLRPMDDATERLWRAWGVVGHLNAVVNTPELRAAYNAALPLTTRFSSEVNQNAALFAQYKVVAQSPDADNAVRRRILDLALQGFRLGGVELEPEARDRFAEIRKELSGLSAKFSENVLDATDAWSLNITDEARMAGVPADTVAACAAAATKAGQTGWTLSLQMPCYLPVLMNADDRDLRRTLYEASVVRASETGPAERDNTAVLDAILTLRAEMADLLGMGSYGDYSLATKMAQSPAEVLAFLRDLAVRARPHALNDRAQLEAFARERLGLSEVEAWDLAYVSEKLKEDRYRFSQSETKAYFTEDKVLSGLFGLVQDLYGVRFVADQAPAWHEDVRFYRLEDADGRLLGQVYLDLYAREGKNGGAWVNVCRNRRAKPEGVQTPLAYLICNFGKGVDGRPATFTHSEVITLFHEMGHALHLLLTEQDEGRAAGFSGVEWDAIELPSQFMENFCWERERVQAMTAHVETGQSLPDAMFDRMLEARNFQSGMQTLRQIELAMFDMRLHSDFDPAEQTVLQLLEQVRDEVAVNRPPEWSRFPHQFSHIFSGSYAAGYYSYKWAEVLSADAYAAFEEGANRLADIGARFRSEVLAQGGGRTAAENFRAFRGRDPDMTALLRHSGMAA